MLWSVGFLVTFLLGGLTGVLLASPPLDWHVSDTYFVVAHFHYVVFGTVVFAANAGLAFWFPKICGRMLDERLGKLQFWMTFIGFHGTFLIQHWLGNEGMPRRYADYLPSDGFTTLNTISTIFSFVLGASIIPFLFNVVKSWKYGQLALRDDPWGHGNSLEWATSSPPPRHNFLEIPGSVPQRPAFEAHYPHLLDRLHDEAHAGKRHEPYAGVSELGGSASRARDRTTPTPPESGGLTAEARNRRGPGPPPSVVDGSGQERVLVEVVEAGHRGVVRTVVVEGLADHSGGQPPAVALAGEHAHEPAGRRRAVEPPHAGQLPLHQPARGLPFVVVVDRLDGRGRDVVVHTLARSSALSARRARPRPAWRELTHAWAKASSSGSSPTSLSRSSTVSAASSGTSRSARRSASCCLVFGAPVSARRQRFFATVSGSAISSGGASAPSTEGARRRVPQEFWEPRRRPPDRSVTSGSEVDRVGHRGDRGVQLRPDTRLLP